MKGLLVNGLQERLHHLAEVELEQMEAARLRDAALTWKERSDRFWRRVNEEKIAESKYMTQCGDFVTCSDFNESEDAKENEDAIEHNNLTRSYKPSLSARTGGERLRRQNVRSRIVGQKVEAMNRKL